MTRDHSFPQHEEFRATNFMCSCRIWSFGWIFNKSLLRTWVNLVNQMMFSVWSILNADNILVARWNYVCLNCLNMCFSMLVFSCITCKSIICHHAWHQFVLIMNICFNKVKWPHVFEKPCHNNLQRLKSFTYVIRRIFPICRGKQWAVVFCLILSS